MEHLCEFEKGDIRERGKDLQGYDVIILGSIGPVFGDFHTTLTILSKCIHENGIFIIDEGYMDDNSPFHERISGNPMNKFWERSKQGAGT